MLKHQKPKKRMPPPSTPLQDRTIKSEVGSSGNLPPRRNRLDLIDLLVNLIVAQIRRNLHLLCFQRYIVGQFYTSISHQSTLSLKKKKGKYQDVRSATFSIPARWHRNIRSRTW
ncbi:hypothetical protein TWF481_003302 [Arthrobotrys musiformis]|uniref:Uncharacterized protein n=1 Tax=Arthrobotrys musiformis TaxID=47236 RepID=A0AAV9VPT9_9PEZI